MGLSSRGNRSEEVVSKPAVGRCRPVFASRDLRGNGVDAFDGMIQSIAGDSITDISRRCGDEAGLRVNLPLGYRARGVRIVDCTLVNVPAQSILANHRVREERAEISTNKCLRGYGGGEGGGGRLAESLVDTEDKCLVGLLINARYVQGA